MYTTLSFPLSFSTEMGCSRPLFRLPSLSLPSAWHALFFRQRRRFLSCLLWDGSGFLVSSGQEVTVVVICNGWYLVNHGDYNWYRLHKLSSIKETFEYLFGAPPLNPLLMVVIGKPPGGKKCWLERHHSAPFVLMNRSWLWSGERNSISKDPPLPWI